MAWEAYRSAPIHADSRADYEARVVRNGTHVSPYTVKSVGTRPAGGWPLFIAMHGGYGAFAIGPKLPDRFAAIHASAAAPTDGKTSAKTLRNTRFTYMIGEKDLAYGRLDRCRAFDATIQKLRADRTDIYPVTMEYQAGHGHVGLPDRDKIGQMYPAIREPVPRELSWELTDPVVADFDWLRAPKPGKGQEIEAVCRDNRVVVKTRDLLDAELLLDSRLVDFDRSVRVEVNGRTREVRLRPSLRVLAETLFLRGDPWLAFSARLVILERYR